jgi:hypothetical protein
MGFGHDAEVELGFGLTLVRRLPEPLRRLGVVLRHALAVVEHDAEVVLGAVVALLNRPAVPTLGLGIV